MNTTLVSDLQVDDVIIINEVLFVVREKKNDRVAISKTTAAPGHGMMSLRFSSHIYEDLQNRTTLLSKAS